MARTCPLLCQVSYSFLLVYAPDLNTPLCKRNTSLFDSMSTIIMPIQILEEEAVYAAIAFFSAGPYTGVLSFSIA